MDAMKYKINKHKHVYIDKYVQSTKKIGYRCYTVELVKQKDLILYNTWEILKNYKDLSVVIKRLYLSKETISCLNHFINQS